MAIKEIAKMNKIDCLFSAFEVVITFSSVNSGFEFLEILLFYSIFDEQLFEEQHDPYFVQLDSFESQQLCFDFFYRFDSSFSIFSFKEVLSYLFNLS